MKSDSYLKEVRNQYEEYPYPARDPQQEKSTLYVSVATALDTINHYCFGGKQSFDKNFRVLVAGGGTGDCTIFLAEQLREVGAEVVYLDFSTASMEVAKARAEMRGLTNITWIHESILNIPNLDLGEFDYITCTGVLHHLEDPEAGLSALKSVLSDQGAMFIMLYGTYGRTAIYQMQDLMRRINSSTEDVEEKIVNTKKTLSMLPQTNWFQFSGKAYNRDLSTDIGIYDLLLHPQDVSYTVPEFYEFIEGQDLTLSKLFHSDHPLGSMLYKPMTYFRDMEILNKIDAMPFKEQAAICELMFGQLNKQEAYAGHQTLEEASLDDMDMVPDFSLCFKGSPNFEGLKSSVAAKGPKVQVNAVLNLKPSEHMQSFFEAMNGERSIGEMLDFVADKSGGSDKAALHAELKQMLEPMVMVNSVCLRHKSLSAVKTMDELKAQMS